VRQRNPLDRPYLSEASLWTRRQPFKVKEEEMHLSDGQLLQELEVVGHLVAGEGEPVVPPGEGIFRNRKNKRV